MLIWYRQVYFRLASFPQSHFQRTEFIVAQNELNFMFVQLTSSFGLTPPA